MVDSKMLRGHRQDGKNFLVWCSLLYAVYVDSFRKTSTTQHSRINLQLNRAISKLLKRETKQLRCTVHRYTKSFYFACFTPRTEKNLLYAPPI